MGMGLFVVPVFDTIIAAVTDAETGSASGVLNAIQQLGGAIGVAVLGTIFFTTLTHSGFAPALRDSMWWEVGVLALMLVVTPLLPRSARLPDAAEAAGAGVGVGAGGSALDRHPDDRGALVRRAALAAQLGQQEL
jgi:hypothetical protein